MTHIMIDLETWGTRPGCDIRSIGATVFDPSTGHIGERGTAGTFYIATDNPETVFPDIGFMNSLEEWRAYDLDRNPKTVEWWNNPERTIAAGEPFLNLLDLREALQTFAEWLGIMCDPADFTNRIGDPMVVACKLWAHGPTFDVSILAAAYEAVGLPIPWHYRAPRDTRTIMEAAGMDPHKGLEQFSTGTFHHALDDAICQAGAVCEAYRLLRTTERSTYSGWEDPDNPDQRPAVERLIDEQDSVDLVDRNAVIEIVQSEQRYEGSDFPVCNSIVTAIKKLPQSR